MSKVRQVQALVRPLIRAARIQNVPCEVSTIPDAGHPVQIGISHE